MLALFSLRLLCMSEQCEGPAMGFFHLQFPCTGHACIRKKASDSVTHSNAQEKSKVVSLCRILIDLILTNFVRQTKIFNFLISVMNSIYFIFYFSSLIFLCIFLIVASFYLVFEGHSCILFEIKYENFLEKIC